MQNFGVLWYFWKWPLCTRQESTLSIYTPRDLILLVCCGYWPANIKCIYKLQFTFCLGWKTRCTEFCLNSGLIYHSSGSQRQQVDENWLRLIIYQDHFQKQLRMYHQNTNLVEKIAELFGKSFIKIRNKRGPRESCVLSCLAFEWKWGWSWPCFDRNLLAFLM